MRSKAVPRLTDTAGSISMKIRIELDEKLKEDEVLIRTSRLTDEIAEIQKTIVQTVNNFQKFTFYKGTTEYFLELRDILFF